MGRVIDVAITRIVAGAEFIVQPLSVPPRVLFAVGNTSGLKPGAEIYGLLRQQN